jgi:hypothetical protein
VPNHHETEANLVAGFTAFPRTYSSAYAELTPLSMRFVDLPGPPSGNFGFSPKNKVSKGVFDFGVCERRGGFQDELSLWDNAGAVVGYTAQWRVIIPDRRAHVL